jgi:hypothetical protein
MSGSQTSLWVAITNGLLKHKLLLPILPASDLAHLGGVPHVQVPSSADAPLGPENLIGGERGTCECAYYSKINLLGLGMRHAPVILATQEG